MHPLEEIKDICIDVPLNANKEEFNEAIEDILLICTENMVKEKQQEEETNEEK